MSPRARSHALELPLAIAAAFYIWAIFSGSLDQDLGFWRTWILELQDGSFAALTANYPPILLQWLWVVGEVYRWIGASVGTDEFLKLWVLLPALLTHLLVLRFLGKTLSRTGRDPLYSPLFWGLALSPVVWLNGPAWGQVDILPLIAIVPALYCADRERVLWIPPLFVFAVSIKFQAIVFAPLLAGICLRHWRQSWKGLPIAAAAFLVAWAPFIADGTLIAAMERAYWSNLSIYPYATLNAGNLWYLLVGNHAPDSINLWTGLEAVGVLESLFTPKWLGLLLFSSISLWVLWRAWRYSDSCPPFSLAVISVLGFFTVSAAMHERYLFMAVPLAALWAACDRTKSTWFWILSLCCFLNMNMILPLQGDFVWQVISWAAVLSLVALLLSHSGLRARPWLDNAKWALERPAGSSWLIALLVWGLVTWNLARQQSSLDAAEISGTFLSDLKPISHEQEWGSLGIDRSVLGRQLQIGQRTYEKGLGTHALSEIEYRIPKGMRRLHCIVGLDGNSGRSGKVQFRVRVDQRVLWQSRQHDYDTGPEAFELTWEDGQILRLEVLPLGQNWSDHANWVDCYFSGGP